MDQKKYLLGLDWLMDATATIESKGQFLMEKNTFLNVTDI